VASRRAGSAQLSSAAAPGRKSNFFSTAARICLSGIEPVPYVSTCTDSGCATPMAYDTWARTRLSVDSTLLQVACA